MHLIVMYIPSNVYRYAIMPQTVPMTYRVVVVLELKHHVMIATSFDSI